MGAKPIGAELIASFFGDDDPAELRGPPRVEASAEPVSDNLAKYWAAAPHHRLLLPLPVSLLHCTARAPCGKSERERAFDDHGRQTERL